MTEALCLELKLQHGYLNNEKVATIYFGGGTPSLLTERQTNALLETVYKYYTVVETPEITLEANPDDLNKDKLRLLRSAGFNRLSIGIQSFREDVLKFLNRAHDQRQALICLADAREAGFQNISIDLIYAIPSENHRNWHDDLATALTFKPEHISSYCLTIEPKTAFGHWLRKGNIPPIDEEFASTQFEILYETLDTAGYEQYEVSNFCLPGHHSRHNSGYWRQEKYLGIGPSAHSYDGINRRFNISHNHKYMAAIATGVVPGTEDILCNNDRINEYLLTTLRTKWGASFKKLSEELHYDLYTQENYLQQLFHKDYARIDSDHLVLTKKGFLLADKIASDLFVV